MRLNHNLASLNLFYEQNKILGKQSAALNRITSGYKVNAAKDDANAISESEKFRMQIRGMQAASKNAQDGASMLQTAEGGLDNITSMLQRVRELAVQAGSDAYSSSDKSIMQSEINQLIKGAGDIANQTEFNGVKLLNKSDGSATDNDNTVQSVIKMPVGANVGETADIPKFNLDFSSGAIKCLDGSTLDLSALDVTQPGGAGNAISMIDTAIDTVVRVRSQYGALENRFSDSQARLDQLSDGLQSADSSIRDVDIAQEIMEYSKDNVLVDAGNAMMAQSNKFPQDILRILDNVRR